ncbi:hypothetical protein Misp01_65750 [Microtetraspora sp. NBRC 13810]|uniref:methyltransferase domain-containing protein n=1 Tax=Microtetraspora sp. NBRC 13810 TaxID=3030990 RepID=UPI0024A1882B|nr:methyltransferase domain-containing protein [Microtetraspora sp. NBRC 13810]GLW11447.1 hypothetical protein Misp01_65750 [Microtetraspora sp. NBRC 13810]
MIITSRSFGEYRAMFALGDGDLRGVVLDCGGGASSFAAGAAGAGARVVAADPGYAHGPDVLAGLLRGDQERARAMVRANADRFVWDWYGTAERYGEVRSAAGVEFIADLRRRPGSYLAAALPCLPFADGSVDLVLCSHLLFTWADRFDLAWHRAAILEMSRVCRGEVRIFPIVHRGAGERVMFLDRLRVDLEAAGLSSEIRRVPYEFQRGADRLLAVGAHR